MSQIKNKQIKNKFKFKYDECGQNINHQGLLIDVNIPN